MYKYALVVCSAIVLSSPVLAQNAIKTTWHCPKETTAQKMDVGDIPDHVYMIAQGGCSATTSSKEFEEKSGAFTEFRNIKGKALTNQGRFIVTLASGDKVYYSYAGSAPADIKKPAANKWTIDGGTGKFKSIKGAGKCSGTRNADESGDWTCTGTYHMGK